MEPMRIVRCTCGGEAISIEASNHEVVLCFWDVGGWGKAAYTFKDRLRLIWRVLKGGLPWSDMLFIEADDVPLLCQFMKEAAEESKNDWDGEDDSLVAYQQRIEDDKIAEELEEEAEKATWTEDDSDYREWC